MIPLWVPSLPLFSRNVQTGYHLNIEMLDGFPMKCVYAVCSKDCWYVIPVWKSPL